MTSLTSTPAAAGDDVSPREKVIHSFTSTTDGSYPLAGLIFDSIGNLYGTAAGGGRYGFGTAFKLSPAATGGWKETIFYNFDIRQGRELEGISRLVFDTAGNLYGETYSGGTAGSGIVFELSPGAGGAWTEKNLYVFSGGADGRYPQGSLIFDGAGNLYGTTASGGAANDGVVFELRPSEGRRWSETVIHNFVGYPNDGENPFGGVIIDKSGSLYGTTAKGGSGGCVGTPACGTIYRLTPGGDGQWTEAILHNFVGGSNDGGFPISTPTFDRFGNLFGTTENGGGTDGCDLQGCGTAYELSPAGGEWQFEVLHVFPAYSGDGSLPGGSLVFDRAGNLYGSTGSGGALGSWCLDGPSFCGTVFELTPTSGGEWTETILHSFGAYQGDGSSPFDLVIDSVGHLYGPAYGGSADKGVVYEVAP
jgi:uncharacterized repeat protein (TIGR03803 family)